MSSFEEFFKLFERGVVALERLADVPQITHSVAPSAEVVVAEAITAAKRARKAKATEAPAVEQPTAAGVETVVTATATPTDEFEAEPALVYTIDDMRTALRAYQQATDPKAAMALLQLHGKASTLSAVAEGLRGAVVKAATEGAKAK